MSRFQYICVALFLGLLCLQGVSLVDYWQEEAYLSQVMDRLAARSLPPSEQAIAVVRSLKKMPIIDNPSYFLLPLFQFFRPTPRQILELGGECGDRSRLVIRLLGVRGIYATKWALYDNQMNSVHAVVEAESETGKMVLDPLYGMWFPRAGTGYYGIHELKEVPEIVRERVHVLSGEGKAPGSLDIRGYPLEKYTYSHAKTINWEKVPGLKAIYGVLVLAFGNAVDDLHRPAMSESPQLMVIFCSAGIQMFLVIVGVWAGRVRRVSPVAKVLLVLAVSSTVTSF